MIRAAFVGYADHGNSRSIAQGNGDCKSNAMYEIQIRTELTLLLALTSVPALIRSLIIAGLIFFFTATCNSVLPSYYTRVS